MSLPSGAAVRRFTRRRSRRRAAAPLSDLLADVYVALLTVAVTTALTLSTAGWLGGAVTAAPPTAGRGLVFAPGWLGALLGLAALAALTGLTARLGPVVLSRPQASWWLGLPVDRRSLLRPAALHWPAVAAAAGAVVGLAAGLVVGHDPAWLAGAALAGAGTAAAGTLLAGLAQADTRAHRRVRRAADATLAATPILGMGLAVAAVPAPVATPALLPVGAAALAAAGLLALVLDRSLGRLRDAVLREGGAVAGEALGSLLSLDTRALGRALSAATEPARRRPRSLGGLGRVPARWRAPAAVVAGDLLLLARSPRHLVQVLVAACLPALALAAPRPAPLLTLAAVLLGAYAAALAAAEGARRAQANTALDALLPLGERAVRRCRLVVPAVVLAGWGLVLGALLAWRYGDPAGWLALGALAGPVWAAAGVRAAYRPLPDFSGPLVHTPMGSIPPGIGAVVAVGPDLAALGSVPVLIALVLGAVPPALLAAQAGLAVVALAVAARVPARPHRPEAPHGPPAPHRPQAVGS
ncbi:DUF6297 family protein [Georgenia sp. TF02-10]|uniref:DUF6297 family protein n=1 Tax=Georgenia sp. TF02-10 TaxID=2917725 RepID=UPI001FA6F35C|nr:DUF6297 family protein [Georgenia sp. TF02-10]UNX53855.1 DUF6297 family protein [Georgenia sp. TF02-10]